MIRKKGRNSWQVAIELPPDPLTGARRQKWFTVRGLKKDAKAAETAAEHERDRGLAVETNKLKVGPYLEQWLTAYAAENVSDKTLNGYKTIAKRWTALLGGLELSKLRATHIQAALGELRASGLAARTTLHYFRVLREALEHACDWQLLARNPADQVKPPRASSPEMHTLSSEEAAALVDALDGQWQRMVQFTIATGCRLGEVLALRWSDVSFDPAYVQVERSVGWLKDKGIYFKPPKSSSGRRRISLSSTTAAMLREHRKEQIELRQELPGWNPQDLVWPTPTGDVQRPHNASASFRTKATRVGFDDLTFHDLRHTCASLMLSSGVNVKVVSEMLGHASPGFTLSVYSHTIPSWHDEAAASLEAVLEAGRAKHEESVANPLPIARLVSN